MTVLVDPDRRPFWPLAALRPVADLLAGTRTFRARWEAMAGGPLPVWCDPEVTGSAFRSGRAPDLNRWPEGIAEGATVAVSTWVPPGEIANGDGPCEWRIGEVAVGWRLDASAAGEIGADPPADAAALRSRLAGLGLPPREAGGTFLDSIWSTMAANSDLLVTDARGFHGAESVSGVDPLVLLGDAGDLSVGADVAIGPFVVLDVRDGPIVLDEGARIEPHSVLRGPLYVGPGTTILGGEVGAGTSIGPRCKVRGEVEQTIVQGFANKAHDGFVGHSAIGEWVNLGADTITSDLKNTYGPVRVEGLEGTVDTGLLKVGAFLGDHVRTGIGTLLTTGARVGVASHVFGGRAVSPRLLPDFSWFDGRERTAVRWEPFERAATIAMGRRGQSLTGPERAMLRGLHEAAVAR